MIGRWHFPGGPFFVKNSLPTPDFIGCNKPAVPAPTSDNPRRHWLFANHCSVTQ